MEVVARYRYLYVLLGGDVMKLLFERSVKGRGSDILPDITTGTYKPEGKYLDGTLGGAGHSSRIAEKLTGEGRQLLLKCDS